MTNVPTSSGVNPTIDTVVRRSYQLASLVQSQLSPDEGDKQLGQFLLSSVMKEAEVRGGPLARVMELRDVSMADGTQSYDVGTDVTNVTQDGMYAPPGESTETGTGLTSVREINRGQWQTLSVKAANGRPYLYFPDRNFSPVRLFMWPTPNEAGTVRFQMQIKLTDATEGASLLPWEDYWIQYYLWELAHQLATAKGLPDNRCLRLASMAQKKFFLAKSYGNQQPPQQFHVDHLTPWNP